MIFEAQRYSYIFSDRVYSMAVGLVVGFVHRLLKIFLSRGKIKVFIKDFITAVIFAVMLYSYVISFANYRVLRWYNVAFALAGLMLFNPVAALWVETALKLAGVTVGFALKKGKKAAAAKAAGFMAEKREKRKNFTQENSSQLLQEQDKVLYN